MADQPQGDARSLYHRWRSRSFSEVVAQEHVTRTLRNAVAGGKISHAYLFCGPRGTGKTSTARILAKAANCLDPREGEPCNRCAVCESIAQGRALDLIEIDAASNRGIDDARDLREKIKFSPAELRYKVYIIDEAHMLTSEASNALLKTLEEPPSHAILILATTEAHKILPTISSRCQRFDFRRIPLPAIVQQLGMICQREGLEVEPGVLDRVARMARGSLRDAESLLDQLVAYCGDRLELASAREVLGLAGEETVPELAEALRRGDLAAGFALIDESASAGADLRHIARELVDYLRGLAMAKSGADVSLTRELSGEELPRLRAIADGWDYRWLLLAIKTFGDLEGRLRVEAFNQVHLEIAFMEVALGEAGGAVVERPADSPPMTEGKRLRPSREPAQAEDGTDDTSAGRSVVPSAISGQGGRGLIVAPDLAPEPSAAPVQPPSGPDHQVKESESPAEAPVVRNFDLEGVRAEWSRIVTELGAYGVAFGRCRPMEVEGNVVTLGVETAGLRSTIERQTVRTAVEEGIGKVFGTRVAVRFKYGVKPDRAPAAGGRDAVVEAAMKEFGFQVIRTEPR